jgi:hypothetical protein
MHRALIATLLALPSGCAHARCIPWAPTLAEFRVDECRSITIGPTSSSAPFSGTLLGGRVLRSRLVWRSDADRGAIPDSPALDPGTHVVLVEQRPEVTFVSDPPFELSVLATPACPECSDGTQGCSRPPIPVVTLEPNPAGRTPVDPNEQAAEFDLKQGQDPQGDSHASARQQIRRVQ